MWNIIIKKLIILGFYLVNSAVVLGQIYNILPAKLLTCFEQKDTSLITGELAPNFSVAGHTGQGASFRLKPNCQKLFAKSYTYPIGQENK